MAKHSSGWSAVEYSTDVNLKTVTELDTLLKEGTNFEPETPTEELSNNKKAACGKGYVVNVRSAKVEDALFSTLVTAEEAGTPVTFRFISLDAPEIIEDCEDAWNESVAAGVTASADASDKMKGTASAKFDVDLSVAAGTILATEAISSTNLSARKEISLWIKSSVALNEGDLQLLLDDTPNCASPIKSLNIPAISANTWTKVNLTIDPAAGLTAVTSVGLKMVVDKGAFTVRLDDIKSVVRNYVIKNALVQHVSEPKPAGAFNARKVTANAYGEQESDILTYTP